MKSMYTTSAWGRMTDRAAAINRAKKKRREIAKALRSKHVPYETGMGRAFYMTREWRHVRWQVLSTSDGRCCMCGRTAKEAGCSLHVDHIKPRSLYPDLELDPTNLQVMCADCNIGKGPTVWKPSSAGTTKRVPSTRPRATNPSELRPNDSGQLKTEG